MRLGKWQCEECGCEGEDVVVAYSSLVELIVLLQCLLPVCLGEGGQGGEVKESHVPQQLVRGGAAESDSQVGLLTGKINRERNVFQGEEELCKSCTPNNVVCYSI